MSFDARMSFFQESRSSLASMGSFDSSRRSSSGVWSLHLNILEQVCELEREHQNYDLNKCINKSMTDQRTRKFSCHQGLNHGSKASLMYKTRPNSLPNFQIYLRSRSVEGCGSEVLESVYSDTDTEDNNEDLQILTPFQATEGLRREAPAYWINSEYFYDPKTQTISLTVRQTGVLPEESKSKLTMDITFKSGAKKQMKRVVLKQSNKDSSFKASTVKFRVTNELQIRDATAKYEIYSHSFLRKQKVSSWQTSLSDCGISGLRANYQKVEFTG